MLITSYNAGVDFNMCKNYVDTVGIPKNDFNYLMQVMQSQQQNPLAQF